MRSKQQTSALGARCLARQAASANSGGAASGSRAADPAYLYWQRVLQHWERTQHTTQQEQQETNRTTTTTQTRCSIVCTSWSSNEVISK